MKWMMALLLAAACLAAALPGPKGSLLADLPELDAQEIARMERLEGGVELTLNGRRLPYDAAGERYLLPVSEEAALHAPELACPDDAAASHGLLRTQDGLFLCAQEAQGVRMSELVFTSLPVISLEPQSGLLPGDAPESGAIILLSGEGGRLSMTSSAMEINLRGNTSRRLPKKSYRVKIVDGDGNKRDWSIAGLRMDDDWIFNPMYSDTSKIREPLAYWLWEQMNSSGGHAESSHAAYAEVILGGEYWGLYGVQERIDRKQVGADKRSGVLYKVFANDRPTAEQLLACGDEETCAGFEVSHAGSGVGNGRWAPAAAYMALLEGGEQPAGAVLSRQNAIDYGLFVMMTQAYDCHFKNQFLNCVYEDGRYVMYKIPWDLNHTFGDAWNGDSEMTNWLDFLIGDELVYDGAFVALLAQEDPAFSAAAAQRWRSLRGGVMTEEAIIGKAYELFIPLQDALLRDEKRWPGSGMGDGNADNIRDIEVFVRAMLPRMDAFAETLSDPHAAAENAVRARR